MLLRHHCHAVPKALVKSTVGGAADAPDDAVISGLTTLASGKLISTVVDVIARRTSNRYCLTHGR